MFKIVQSIYDQGGRYFWIHNTGPLGCLAYVLERVPVKASEVDHVGCASPINEVAQYFNRKLKDVVGHLRKKLPHASFTYVDVYSVKYDLIHHATKYGTSTPFLFHLFSFIFIFYFGIVCVLRWTTI